MKRETRANLIFLAVLACLMGPPIGITIAKRWGTPGRLIEPPQVRDRLAFLDRTAGLSAGGLSRVVPPQTGAYVAQLTDRVVAIQRGLKSLVGDGRFAPIMSDALNLQWVAEGAHEGKFRVLIIAWSGKLLPLPSYYKLAGTRAGQPVPAAMESFETQNMPIELRRELQSYGYILPPDGLIWIIAAFDGVEPVDSVSLHYDALGFRMDDVVRRAASPTTAPTATTASVTP